MLATGAQEPTLTTSDVAQAAGLVVRSTHGRILLAEPTTKPRWDVVGGVVEVGESVVEAARREALEEVGVPLEVGDLLVVDACRATTEREAITCFLLDGGVHEESLTDTFTYPDGELVRAHWVAPGAVLDRCGPRIGRRLTAVLEALRTGRLPGPPLRLVDGAPER
ncbi:MAG TPA: NUDIX hydrolase [Angustibacter sp.]|nr:NUDIX hydrolase [Angustibacter sp.]